MENEIVRPLLVRTQTQYGKEVFICPNDVQAATWTESLKGDAILTVWTSSGQHVLSHRGGLTLLDYFVVSPPNGPG